MSDANGAAPDTNAGGGSPGAGPRLLTITLPVPVPWPGLSRNSSSRSSIGLGSSSSKSNPSATSSRSGSARSGCGVKPVSGCPIVMPAPGCPLAKSAPGVYDVGILKTPLEVTGSGRIIASARRAGYRRLLHVCNVVLEQRFRVDDLGLRPQPIHRIPRGAGRDSLRAPGRYELELALVAGNGVHAPACEPGLSCSERRGPFGRFSRSRIHRERNGLELRISILRCAATARPPVAGWTSLSRATCGSSRFHYRRAGLHGPPGAA